MKHFESSLQANDGTSIYARVWEPDGDSKACVCLVHGLGEHSGRYAHVAQALTDAGYAVVAHDLRGHGKTGGQRGHSPSFETMMDDVGALLDAGRDRYPSKPRFLYGHSLGAILALNYALRRRPEIAGVVSTAVGLHSALAEQKAKVAMAKLLGSLLPSAGIASGLDPATISRDPDVVKRYIEDPLVHDRLSFGFGKQLLNATGYAMEHAAEFPVPLLLMHGGDDRLGFPSGSTEFASRLGAAATIRVWDGLSHEIHNEPEQGEVLRYLIDWLDSRLGTSPRPA